MWNRAKAAYVLGQRSEAASEREEAATWYRQAVEDFRAGRLA